MKLFLIFAVVAQALLTSCASLEQADIEMSYGGKQLALKKGVVSMSYDIRQLMKPSGKQPVSE